MKKIKQFLKYAITALAFLIFSKAATAQCLCSGSLFAFPTQPTCHGGSGNIELIWSSTPNACCTTVTAWIQIQDSAHVPLYQSYTGYLSALVPPGIYYAWFAEWDISLGNWVGPNYFQVVITNPSCTGASSTIIKTDAHQGCNDGKIDVVPVNRQPASCTVQNFSWAHIYGPTIVQQNPLWGDTAHFSNLPPGVYQVFISENGGYTGCYEEVYITINEIPCSFAPIITKTNPTTYGGMDGTLTTLENNFHCQGGLYYFKITSVADTNCQVSWGNVSGYSSTITSACGYAGPGFSAGTYNIHFWDPNATGCTADYSVTFTDPCLSCPVPTNINATNIKPTAATINWTGNTCAVKYRVRYRVQGTTTWTVKTMTAPTITKTLTSLLPLTTYQYQVRTDCNSTSTFNSTYSAIQTFTTPCVCSKPAAINVTNITQTSAKVNWTGNACAYKYWIQYRKQGTTTWTSKSVLAPIVTKTITGLQANSIYEYRLRTDCDVSGTPNSGYTTIQTFTTALRIGEDAVAAFSETEQFEINIKPNPVSNMLGLNFHSENSTAQIKIVNTIGQTVFSKQLFSEDGNYEEQLSVLGLKSGIYILFVQTENGFGQKKFVKE